MGLFSEHLALSIRQSIDSLYGLVELLDDEHAALRSSDIQAVARLSRDKAAGLTALSGLLTELRLRSWPEELPVAELQGLLDRCQQQNRRNGILMNLMAAQRQADHGQLGLSSDGYGRSGMTALRADSRRIASA